MVRSLALLGSSAILAAAGCGGDAEPSRDEFISKAKAICAEAQKKRDAIEAAAGPSAEQRFTDPAVMKRDNDVGRDAIAKLKALEAPEEERAGLRKVIAAGEREAAATDDRIAALKAKDGEAEQRASDAREVASDDVAAAVGATDLAGCETL